MAHSGTFPPTESYAISISVSLVFRLGLYYTISLPCTSACRDLSIYLPTYQSFSPVRLCGTPQTEAHQATLSITNYRDRKSVVQGKSGNSVRLFHLGSKITADGDCSHEIKRHLLTGRKVMTNLNSILKSRSITLPTKVCLVKAMVFPVVTSGYESWTVRKLSTEKLMLLNCGVGEDS